LCEDLSKTAETIMTELRPRTPAELAECLFHETGFSCVEDEVEEASRENDKHTTFTWRLSQIAERVFARQALAEGRGRTVPMFPGPPEEPTKSGHRGSPPARKPKKKEGRPCIGKQY
jgi:hypothetical protein